MSGAAGRQRGFELMHSWRYFPSLVSANTSSLKANPQLCISLVSWGFVFREVLLAETKEEICRNKDKKTSFKNS